jgi:hypothetical protein
MKPKTSGIEKIIFAMILLIIALAFSVYMATKTLDNMAHNGGLKAVVEKVWLGDEAGKK